MSVGASPVFVPSSIVTYLKIKSIRKRNFEMSDVRYYCGNVYFFPTSQADASCPVAPGNPSSTNTLGSSDSAQKFQISGTDNSNNFL